MSNEILSKEELIKERTPPELWTWWKERNDQIYWAGGEEARKDLRLHNKGLAKRFMEEIWPLAKFGMQKFGDTDRILMRWVDQEKYDAVVTDLRTKPASQSYIEITQSHEGENEHGRNTVLHNRGFISRYGKVVKTRTKKTGIQFSVEPGGAPPAKAAEDDLERIIAAANGKAGKEYPANTSLIIFFDDSLNFPRLIDDTQLDHFVTEKVLSLDLKFSTLYLVGWEHVFREYSLIKKI